jgi:large conductance mechanosensitive channel
MGLVKEFKEFAMRGNVLDMAVGIIIGGAFGKIISSFVNDVIMPPIGLLLGGMDFKEFKILIKSATVDAAGKDLPAVFLNYGMFIQTLVDFLIIAFAIFIMVKAINSFKRKQEEVPAAPAEPPAQEKLLSEIRDLLKNR